MGSSAVRLVVGSVAVDIVVFVILVAGCLFVDDFDGHLYESIRGEVFSKMKGRSVV